MSTDARARRRRLEGEEEEERLDRISGLPDGVLGEIVSLLPTKDGARTQILSSRWRPVWRSAPLNLDLSCGRIPLSKISRILSSHPGPGRRFSIPRDYVLATRKDCSATLKAGMDGWLQSPGLINLQELEFYFYLGFKEPPSLLPASARRFASTLRVASFGGCSFPDGDNASALQLPVLKQLSLLDVTISESSLNFLLAACPVLQSLMLTGIIGCPRIQIMSCTVRSIAIKMYSGGKIGIKLHQLIIHDAPCLERLLLFGQGRVRSDMVISVIWAPKLSILGQLPGEDKPRLEFGHTIFQGSRVVNSAMPVPSVKVLALTHINLSLDVVIDFMKCFPCLENLYVKMACGIWAKVVTIFLQSLQLTMPRFTNAWRHKYRNLIGTLDIHLKKVVVTNYRGNKAHVNFAKFFVLNARDLESMVLEGYVRDDNEAWIKRQHTLLQIENRASRGAQFDFVSSSGQLMCHYRERMWSEQALDLLTADPFVKFHGWY